MKKISLILTVIFLFLLCSCQQSQFSTTTRQTRNGKVTYSHHHRTERLTRVKTHSKSTRKIQPDAGENSSTGFKKEDVNSPELQILKNLPAEIPSGENLLASNSIHPTPIILDVNKSPVTKNPKFLHRGNRVASGKLITSFLSRKSSHKPVSSATRPKVETNGLLGFIFSILGFIPVIGIFLSLAGIIFSSISLYKFKHDQSYYSGKGLAIAGLILGIISLLANIVLIIALVVDMSNFSIGGGVSVI